MERELMNDNDSSEMQNDSDEMTDEEFEQIKQELESDIARIKSDVDKSLSEIDDEEDAELESDTESEDLSEMEDMEEGDCSECGKYESMTEEEIMQELTNELYKNEQLKSMDEMYDDLEEGELEIDKANDKTIITHHNESKKVNKQKPVINESKELKKLKEEYDALIGKVNVMVENFRSYQEKSNLLGLEAEKLALVNRLFVETYTNKQQKEEIIDRFKNAKNINEAKELYKTVKGEYSKKTKVDENKTVVKETTIKNEKNVVSESAIEKRTRELMEKLSK
jgi:hypothetical protein